MIAIRLKEGLGNQMFQYALGRRIELETNQKVIYDASSFKWSFYKRTYALDVFKLKADVSDFDERRDLFYVDPQLPLFRKFLRRLKRLGWIELPMYKEKHFHYDPECLGLDQVYLDGYWQSEKYFSDYRTELLKDFTIRDELLSETCLKYANEIGAGASVSVHLRLMHGFSLNGEEDPGAVAFFGACGMDFFKRCFEQIEKSLRDPVYYVFSDNVPMAREILKSTNCRYVEGLKDYEDLYLMTRCRHNIISNSSFGWWAAWLNPNPEKLVFAPAKWFQRNGVHDLKDIYASGWEVI
jgi:hypothetical protein